MMRLQKFLAQAGIASRRKAEDLIKAGKIKVNGEVITKLGTTINETKDRVEFNHKKVIPNFSKTYIAVHKPVGYISSASSDQGQSVLSLIGLKQRLYPVGRLDKDSCGLLLLTDDGEFTNQITHAKFGLEKEYFVILDHDLKPEDIKKLEKGMFLKGKIKLQPIKVVMAKNKSARLILHEGVNRQIRRMLGSLGYTVVKLKRIRIGKLELGELKPGQWRKVRPEEVI